MRQRSDIPKAAGVFAAFALLSSCAYLQPEKTGQMEGDQGQPGSLGVGDELTFKFRTNAKTARLIAMVHPDKTPDNYVAILLDLESKGTVELVRFDIRDDEQRKTVEKLSSVDTVTVR